MFFTLNLLSIKMNQLPGVSGQKSGSLSVAAALSAVRGGGAALVFGDDHVGVTTVEYDVYSNLTHQNN
jgi:hypothetical protein